jgi:hypothetical protein
MPRVIAERKGQSILHSVTTKTRKKLWEDRVFSPILGDDGEVAYILESVRDVTRVKNLEIYAQGDRSLFGKDYHRVAHCHCGRRPLRQYPVDEPRRPGTLRVFQRGSRKNISAANLYPKGLPRKSKSASRTSGSAVKANCPQ